MHGYRTPIIAPAERQFLRNDCSTAFANPFIIGERADPTQKSLAIARMVFSDSSCR